VGDYESYTSETEQTQNQTSVYLYISAVPECQFTAQRSCRSNMFSIQRASCHICCNRYF